MTAGRLHRNRDAKRTGSIVTNVKIATWINTHKLLVTPAVLAMMGFYGNWSTEAFVYLSLHGTYAVLWLIKQTIFRDKSFEERLPVAIGFFFVFLPLAGYLLAPYLLISRRVQHPPWWIALVLFVYIMGIFLHYVSDAQKYFTLLARPGLITTGFFRLTRNPNYLGELLIYLSYALLAAHWLPFVVLGGWVASFFVRMRKKDRSLSRYPEFEGYRAKTGMLFPL
jgi:protein-S-isoprenylcysteine O-methyltransferase Ste14